MTEKNTLDKMMKSVDLSENRNDIFNDIVKNNKSAFKREDKEENKNKKEKLDDFIYTTQITEFIIMDKNDFETKFNQFLNLLKENQDLRIIYSDITNNIYQINDINKIQDIEINLNIIRDKIKSGSIAEVDNPGLVKKRIIKIYDHFNLALNQVKELKQDNEVFKKNSRLALSDDFSEIREEIDKLKLELINEDSKNNLSLQEKIQNLKNEDINKIREEINNLKLELKDEENKNNSSLQEKIQNLKNEFIGLIGIFTAMSFLVFGGLEFLGGIFKDVADLPILKMLIIASLWSLCLSNLIYMFMFFIESLSLKKEEKIKYIEKYPIIKFTNYIFIIILLFCSYFYYCRKNNIDNLTFKIAKTNPNIYLVILSILVLIPILNITINIIRNKKINTN